MIPTKTLDGRILGDNRIAGDKGSLDDCNLNPILTATSKKTTDIIGNNKPGSSNSKLFERTPIKDTIVGQVARAYAIEHLQHRGLVGKILIRKITNK